ncbi:helix-turn-helix transcriptional regulator [Streptomyces sp. NPDC088387]|uniref:helix-turn-helix transcriptional regulator n=1 Tax=Streptomyces sp. NPDC088387 TaxID=3365859 RepID=UPI003828201B
MSDPGEHPEHPEHGVEDLCAAGTALYRRALTEGHVSVTEAEAAAAPCLVDFGLLYPAVDDLSRLEPVAPTLALQQLLRASAQRIADERRREERLARAFEPLLRARGPYTAAPDDPSLRILSSMPRINEVLNEVMADASRELLCVQPHTSYIGKPVEPILEALVRDQALLDRGARIRTLYQHTLRHHPAVVARYEQLDGDVEARTLDEVTERLIVIDRRVAYVPANEERTLALEIRVPAIVEYFATAFDRLWRLATPMHPRAVQQPSLNGVTARQHAIAALLVEGHTDAVIADRLGMNIRTARVHIAKLAATLGSESRAQLGYLIGRSGILDREG